MNMKITKTNFYKNPRLKNSRNSIDINGNERISK